MIKGLSTFFIFGFVAAPCIAQIPITVTGSVPSSIDNSTAQWFPPIVSQGMTEGCGNATGIGYIFNHEMSASRGVSSKTSANQYPFYSTFAFLNNGIEDAEETLHVYHRHFLPAFRIGQENGIPNLTDYGTNNLNSTRWMSGYDKYYRAMQNRVDKIDSIAMTDSLSLNKMKQWLYDHGNGSSNGGIFVVTGNIYCTVETAIASGVEAGKTFIKGWGWSTDPNDTKNCRVSTHAMAIVGYNDKVQFDFNGDGKFTNTIDINKDGKITLADMEIGAFKVANTWGTSAWDNGMAYAGYRLLFSAMSEGGIAANNRLYFITVKKEYTPKIALKINITNSIRKNIALSVGVAPDLLASTPAKVRAFQRQFTYSGGTWPMCGKGASASIEIGLDITDLLDSIPDLSKAKYFLVVDSKGGSGTVDSLSLMDYRSGTLKQIKSQQSKVPIAAGTSSSPVRTYVSVSDNSISVIASPGRRREQAGICIKKVNGMLHAEYPLTDHATISVLDMRGKTIAHWSAASRDQSDLPSSMSAGIYLVSIQKSSGSRLTAPVSIPR
jgi:hypothetical protein